MENIPCKILGRVSMDKDGKCLLTSTFQGKPLVSQVATIDNIGRPLEVLKVNHEKIMNSLFGLAGH